MDASNYRHPIPARKIRPDEPHLMFRLFRRTPPADPLLAEAFKLGRMTMIDTGRIFFWALSHDVDLKANRKRLLKDGLLADCVFTDKTIEQLDAQMAAAERLARKARLPPSRVYRWALDHNVDLTEEIDRLLDGYIISSCVLLNTTVEQLKAWEQQAAKSKLSRPSSTCQPRI